MTITKQPSDEEWGQLKVFYVGALNPKYLVNALHGLYYPQRAP
jgi:hypothetical protein